MDAQAEFRRTFGYGEAALGQLKRNEIPAYPRNYELWYAYAAGYHPALNQAVNAILERGDRVDTETTAALYTEFVSSGRLGDEIQTLGSHFSRQLDAVAGRITATLGSSTSYQALLERTRDELGSSDSARGVRRAVDVLVDATGDMIASNKTLEGQLAEARLEVDKLRDKLEVIRFESLSDDLTKLGNRRLFDESIERALEGARETAGPVSLLLADVDHFKRFNDTYGHPTGDQVLRLVGSTLKSNIKGQDIACRYGGEEFAIILPQTPLKKAVIVAEIIRKAVMARELVKRSTGESLGRVTISVGVAALRPDDNAAALIERADACLYAAKRSGRNRVRHEGEADAVQQVA